MGKLIDGHWSKDGYEPDDKGHFVRQETTFRGAVTADGSSGFRAEAGRYHLYVSLACPWAHRTLIARALKGLESTISISIVQPHMGQSGWEFGAYPGATSDMIHQAHPRTRAALSFRARLRRRFRAHRSSGCFGQSRRLCPSGSE